MSRFVVETSAKKPIEADEVVVQVVDVKVLALDGHSFEMKGCDDEVLPMDST